ncbi:MAG TPA: 3-oxoacyl-ACP reductase FabG [Dehalococcoidia bacterium]|nr:3-oxoacyl-ACP reductase FabG [Dehalococcoidia bacterium]
MIRLEDKVAIVTGASRGIGKAVAMEFARQGANLVVVAVTDKSAAQEVTDSIEELGRDAITVMADVSQRAEVNGLVKAAIDRFGRVNILVNNAGILNPSPLMELTEEQWDRTINVHLKGTFNCTQAVAQHMKEMGGGQIINVTAPSVLRASTLGVADYAAAKGGIVAFTKTAAKELATFGITVNCISPAVYTRMTESLMSVDQSTLEERAERVPLGWFGQPEDVAPAFVFFACKDADYITGQVLAVDGGSTL